MTITINTTSTAEEKQQILVNINGRLDTVASQECAEQWQQIMSFANGDIVLDFARLEYIASSGLRLLLSLRREVQSKGGTLTLKNVCSEVMQILKMTGCKDMFSYAE